MVSRSHRFSRGEDGPAKLATKHHFRTLGNLGFVGRTRAGPILGPSVLWLRVLDGDFEVVDAAREVAEHRLAPVD